MKKGYITIQEWMLELGLTPSQLIAYAVIYGFSQAEQGTYFGGASYIARWAHVCLRTAKSDLAALEQKGLIVKSEIKRRGCVTLMEYKVKNDE